MSEETSQTLTEQVVNHVISLFESGEIGNFILGNFRLEEVFDMVDLLGVVKEGQDLLDMYDIKTVVECFLENCDVEEYVDATSIVDNYLDNNTPEEAFGTIFLRDYFLENYHGEMVEHIRSVDDPEDVFAEDELVKWAERNGWVKKEDLKDES